MEPGFVFLDEVLSGVRWDAKYATWDNFTGTPVEGYEVNRIVGSYALADALLEAKTRAAALGFGLLLWDGYRPQRAVNRFLEWSAQPEDGRTKQRFYPNIDRAEMFTNGYVAPKSGHSRGSAVDLTLYRLDTGELAAMGGGHDLMDERSHHGATRSLGGRSPRIAGACVRSWNTAGSNAYDREWWHYVLQRRAVPRHLLRLPDPVGAGDAIPFPRGRRRHGWPNARARRVDRGRLVRLSGGHRLHHRGRVRAHVHVAGIGVWPRTASPPSLDPCDVCAMTPHDRDDLARLLLLALWSFALTALAWGIGLYITRP